MVAAADRTLRGTVTRIGSEGVFVEVPKLGLGVEYGPCQVYAPAVLLGRTEEAGGHAHTFSDSTGTGTVAGTTSSEAAHRHELVLGRLALQVRDQVLVSTVNGVKEDLVVVGRLA